MRALIITGGEFAAQHFANINPGKSVEEIIENQDIFQDELDTVFGEGEIELEVVDAGDVSRDFISRLRGIADYDHEKQSRFWMEYETI